MADFHHGSVDEDACPIPTGVGGGRVALAFVQRCSGSVTPSGGSAQRSMAGL